MSQGNPLENLQNAGYSQGPNQGYAAYLQEEDPTSYASTLQGFKGYNPAQNDAASGAQAQQTRGQQEGLISQLQQGAAGIGPNAGAAQLTAATGANIKNQAALLAAAGASGAGGAGAARYNAADQAGQLNQAAGNQAAQIGAQGQQSALQGLAGVTGQVAGQDLSQQQILNQNGQNNMLAQNQAGQYNSQSLQAQAALQQRAYEYQQSLLAQSQGQQNSAVAGLQGQQEAQEAAYTSQGISGATSAIGSVAALAAKGKVVSGPKTIVAGEAGREARVPVPPEDVPRGERKTRGEPRMAGGGVVGNQLPSNNQLAGQLAVPPPPNYSNHISGLGGLVQKVIAGIRGNGQPSPGSPGSSPANNWSSPVSDDTPTVGGGSELGDFSAAQGGAAAKGRLLTQPTEIEAGEAGPEAIIPVKGDGSADMKRAKDPGVRKLIKDHPEYKHPLSAGGNDQTLSHLAELKAEVAKLEKVLKSTRRAA